MLGEDLGRLFRLCNSYFEYVLSKVYVRQQMSNDFDQIGVLCMAIKSFIVKFDTIECVSLLFGCCNIKIWSYKLNQVIFLERAWPVLSWNFREDILKI